MPDITHEVKVNNGPNDPFSIRFGADKGINDPYIDRNLLRKPDSYVYIFSVAKRDIPSMDNLIRTGVIAVPMEAAAGTYQFVAAVPDPFQLPEINLNNNTLYAVSADARAIAQNYCWPANTSLNQDVFVPVQNIFGAGNNKTQMGVFWVEEKYCTFKSETREVGGKSIQVKIPVPPPLEVTKAEKRVAKYYQGLLERARVLELTDKKQLEDELNIDFHLAADFYKIETTWHTKVVRNISCHNCGTPILPNQKFHMTTYGPCVEPSKEGWQAVEKALGAKIRSSVPEEFVWFEKEKKSKIEKLLDSNIGVEEL